MIRVETDIIKLAENFSIEHLKPIAKKLDEDSYCPKGIIEKMVEEGFFKIHYPIEYGGYGMNCSTSFNVVREISKVSPGIGLLLIVHWMAVDVLIKYGSQDQKNKYLRDLVEGKKIAAYTISESGAGSDVGGITSVAQKVDNSWKLNGSKYFSTNGGLADIYFITCKTDVEKGVHGISLFILDKDTKGFKIGEPIDKMGLRSSITTSLKMKDCIVPEQNIVGEQNKGFKISMEGLNGGRLGMVAIGIGIGEAALESSCKHANKRKAFGKPIGNLYSIQEKIAEMHTDLEASRALFEKACSKRDKGLDYSLDASIAKVFTGKAVNRICYNAIQIFGGHGYVRDNHVERYYRDGRLLDIGVGTTEVLNMFIGNNVLKTF